VLAASDKPDFKLFKINFHENSGFCEWAPSQAILLICGNADFMVLENYSDSPNRRRPKSATTAIFLL